MNNITNGNEKNNIPSSERKIYSPPELVEYGDISEITKSGEPSVSVDDFPNLGPSSGST